MITGRRGKGEMWWEQIANPTRHALWCWNGWRWRLDARLLWHGVHCSWWPVAKENEDENLTGHPDRFDEAHLFVFCQYKSTHATLRASFCTDHSGGRGRWKVWESISPLGETGRYQGAEMQKVIKIAEIYFWQTQISTKKWPKNYPK